KEKETTDSREIATGLEMWGSRFGITSAKLAFSGLAENNWYYQPLRAGFVESDKDSPNGIPGVRYEENFRSTPFSRFVNWRLHGMRLTGADLDAFQKAGGMARLDRELADIYNRRMRSSEAMQRSERGSQATVRLPHMVERFLKNPENSAPPSHSSPVMARWTLINVPRPKVSPQQRSAPVDNNNVLVTSPIPTQSDQGQRREQKRVPRTPAPAQSKEVTIRDRTPDTVVFKTLPPPQALAKGKRKKGDSEDVQELVRQVSLTSITDTLNVQGKRVQRSEPTKNPAAPTKKTIAPVQDSPDQAVPVRAQPAQAARNVTTSSRVVRRQSLSLRT
ncbi:hypothetical protein QBC46DRAFT_347721, partial [Diplogelasinospora grovesii]